MRIDPTLRRIRAVIRTAAVNVAYKAGVIGSAVVVPYIRFRYALGEFFKLKFITDTARVSEGELYFAEDYTTPGYVGIPFALSVGKVLTDTAIARDVLAFFAPRSFSDSFSVADTDPTRLVGKGVSDTATMADAATRIAGKGLADTAVAADAAARSAGKSLADTASTADSPVFLAGRVLSDTATATDARAFSLIRPVVDTYVATDVAVRRPTKVLADTVATADAAIRAATKALADTANLLDVVALAPRLVIIDQPVASDSGSLLMQDYCEITYFAEDYVGVSRAFT